MKKHTTRFWGEFSPRAYVSNGFAGFRFGKNAFEDSWGLLAGFTAIREQAEVEAQCVVPTPILTFYYNGDPIQPETVSQTYDFSCGEFITNAALECDGKSVEVEYTVFCSRTSPSLLIGIVKASGEIDGKLTLTVNYKMNETYAYMVSDMQYFNPRSGHHDGKYLVYSRDRSTTCGVAFRLLGNTPDLERNGEMSAKVTLEPSGKELYIITSYIPGIMHGEPHNQAERMLVNADWLGVELIREQNKKAWAKLWESRVVVDGATERWQDAIDASFFYLMSSCSEFSPMSASPYGLSLPLGYYGHCFWDTESFMFMPQLFCNKHIAENMLEYRFKRIDAAQNNARINGYRGIQFPWESHTKGYEVVATWANCGGEQHVNMDVALAFDGYARVHGDEFFIKERAWPVIKGVCEWVESRVEKTDRGYEILHITGIDEETDNVNNDSYSNIMAAKVLKAGCRYSEMLGYGKRADWEEVADRMFVPINDDGVLLQYEGMPEKERQVATNLMAYFPYGYDDGKYRDTFKSTCEYYISHGIEHFCNYPMLSGFVGIFPAWLGDREYSKKLYEIGNLDFFSEPFWAPVEWRLHTEEERTDPKQELKAVFVSGRGALLSGLIMGLCKMCPFNGEPNGSIEAWFGEDIVLPDGWNKITVGKITVRGKNYRLEAEQGAKKAKLTEI